MECYQNVNIFNENIYGLHWLVRFNKTAPEMEKNRMLSKCQFFFQKYLWTALAGTFYQNTKLEINRDDILVRLAIGN